MLMRTRMTFSQAEATEILRQSPLFAGLEIDVMTLLAAGAHRGDYRGEQMIRPAGQIWTRVDIVGTGLVKRASITRGGTERVMQLAGPGEVVGLAEVLAGRPAWSQLVAVERSALLSVDVAALRRAMVVSPTLAATLLESLARRQGEAEQELVLRDTCSATQRVLAYLLRLHGCADLPKYGETIVRLPARKQLIAARVGLTPESLSRALRDLTKCGLARVKGRELRLNNAEIARATQH